MSISAKGLRIIEIYEGCKLKSYICPAGKWTVGIGHVRTAKPGMIITKEQAYDLLRSDLEISEASVKRHNLNLNQNQFDALVSFAFNLGSTAFRGSSLLKKIRLNASEDEIRHQFSRWVHAKGKPIPGLIARRTDEANLYFLPNTL